MKKNVFLFAMLFFVLRISAQDIIITTGSERIEAKILEVSSSEIKYKRFNNQDGPLFIIETKKVSSILYSNGEVQAFEPQEDYAKQESKEAYIRYPKMMKSGNRFYYGNDVMDKHQYSDYLQINCPIAYQTFIEGNGLVGGGTAFFVAGSILDIGSVIYAVKLNADRYATNKELNLAIWMGVIGGAFEIAAIPMWIVGGVKKSKSVDIFNEQCNEQQKASQVTLKFQASQNGLGVAMNF